jgi:hypothetical protein
MECAAEGQKQTGRMRQMTVKGRGLLGEIKLNIVSLSATFFGLYVAHSSTNCDLTDLAGRRRERMR